MTFDWTKDLSEADRSTVNLALTYETVRRKTHFGYRIFDLTQDPTKLPIFKAFRTVEHWLDAQGAKIQLGAVTWKGYVEYCFSKLAPTVPQPGQLKNPVLLREYLTSTQLKSGKRTVSRPELEQLYRRILRPELVSDPGLMELLGFRNIELIDGN